MERDKESIIKSTCKAITDESLAVIRDTFRIKAMTDARDTETAKQFEKMRVDSVNNIQRLVDQLKKALDLKMEV